MKNATELANKVYKLASGSNATPEFITWFIENETKFNLTEEDYNNISRNSLNIICDMAEAAGFSF
jgi:hypothetical protein